MEWVTIEDRQGDYTEAMGVPGGVVLRSHHWTDDSLSESMVFVLNVQILEDEMVEL
jgi:hypothetical protein